MTQHNYTITLPFYYRLQSSNVSEKVDCHEK
jgi:hypothetical protein